MRIVGRTDEGYLAQITEDEIHLICGAGRYPAYCDDDTKTKALSMTGRKSFRDHIPTNTTIEILKGFNLASEIRDKRKSALKAAKELREIADLLESPPKLICEPDAPPEA